MTMRQILKKYMSTFTKLLGMVDDEMIESSFNRENFLTQINEMEEIINHIEKSNQNS